MNQSHIAFINKDRVKQGESCQCSGDPILSLWVSWSCVECSAAESSAAEMVAA